MSAPDPSRAVCPLPLDRYPTVTMAHGGGGRLGRQLVEELFLAAYASPELRRLHDGAALEMEPGRVAFTTDSYVITPPFFPGGDIGSLAVHGTVNDLAMCGARPRALSVSFILEEGFAMEDLWRIARSIHTAAAEAGVEVVTGDTKVVDRGSGDGVFINTSGVGTIDPGVDVGPHRMRSGDAVLVSGPLANHGIAILSLREGLAFETALESDSQPLNGLVTSLLERFGDAIHALRDPTRGGVASALNEMAETSESGVRLDEAAIPVDDQVRGACEILGLDPLYVANEGKLLAIVDAAVAEEALAFIGTHRRGRGAARIGTVVREHAGQVTLRSRIGGDRVVDMLSGEQLPRIC
jgi:hydrogenase expression/formation protein HypE